MLGAFAGQLTVSTITTAWAQETSKQLSRQSASQTQTQAPLFKENTINLSVQEIGERTLEKAKKSLTFAKAFQDKMAALLKAADSYDVESYKKADEELTQILTEQDANYLESAMLEEAFYKQTPEPKGYDRKKNFALIRESMQQCKLYSLQSSAIFYQCFGLPLESVHCAKLALSLSGSLAPSAKNTKLITDLLFYQGTAALWAGDYQGAETCLKEVLKRDPQHLFNALFLGETYVAQQKYDQAIVFLKEALKKEKGTELAGHLNCWLALALTLNKQKNEALPYAREAEACLVNDRDFTFKAVALESRGIARALTGDYTGAENLLSQALNYQQLSPLKLGNRLEASQVALWRSYCRKMLGKEGAPDHEYALSISSQAPHLKDLNTLLGPLFGLKAAAPITEAIPQRWAILVGISNFQDPTIPKLRYPAKDAQDMKAFLINRAGFKSDHIQLLVDKDATQAALTDKLQGHWLADKMQNGDLVFLFISSHGTPAYPEIGALNSIVSYDTKLDQLFSTSLPMQNLIATIARRYSKQYSFVVLDTCYAGGLAAPFEAAKTASSPDPELLYISQRQLFLSSSDKTERSWESKRYPNSIFTRQFLTCLEKNTGYTDFHSLFQDIAQRVNCEVVEDYHHRQNPKMAGHWKGQGIISPDEASGARKSN